jgi:indole-3-glycerol phosphate synthase
VSDVLTEICDRKRQHVAARKIAMPAAQLEKRLSNAPAPRGFAIALASTVVAGGYGLIAEIKKASPSKGLIREDFDPPALAQAYAAGGATCLSVLTDEPYFQGTDEYMVAAREAVSLPVLRKDFIVDRYQVIESRVLGADCILLIMACLDDLEAKALAADAKAPNPWRRWCQGIGSSSARAGSTARKISTASPRSARAVSWSASR